MFEIVIFSAGARSLLAEITHVSLEYVKKSKTDFDFFPDNLDDNIYNYVKM